VKGGVQKGKGSHVHEPLCQVGDCDQRVNVDRELSDDRQQNVPVEDIRLGALLAQLLQGLLTNDTLSDKQCKNQTK